MIRVEGLSCRHPCQSSAALDRLTLEVGAGELLLLSGPTGSGKSTLGLCLCGAIPRVLHAEVSGRVEVGGIDPARVPIRELASRIGLLAQDVESQLFTDRVDDEVAFGLENLGVPAAEMAGRVDRALAEVGAARLRGRGIATLSSGERQRVAVAAVLALGQGILVLDEPLAYLDRAGAARLLETLAALARRGTAVVVLEHRRDLVLPFADRELWLHGGRRCPGAAPDHEFPSAAGLARGGPCRLAFAGVEFGWGAAPLFEWVSCEVAAGERAVLIGDNGTGKTTLLRLALGLARAHRGRVATCGHDAGATPTRQLARRAALVLQNPDHQLHLPTVAEEVSWGAVPAAAEREVETLGLRGLEARHPHSLSTGQKRRVTLAAALARAPDLLLLDEPSVGQDDGSLARVLGRLGEYVAAGGALVAATHDRRVARSLARRVLCLARGRLTTGGPDLMEHHFAAAEAVPVKAAAGG